MLISNDLDLRSIVGNFPLPFVVLDDSLTIILANKLAEKHFGERLKYKKCYELYSRKKVCDNCCCDTAIEEGTAAIKIPVFGKNGRMNYYDCSLNVVARDEIGKPVCFVKIFSEVKASNGKETILNYRVALEELLVQVSRYFIAHAFEPVDSGIEWALGLVGEFCDVDRSYVFLYDKTRITINNTHEWCREGIEPQQDALQDLPVVVFPWWDAKMTAFEDIYIPCVQDLPLEAAAEREEFMRQDIKSLLGVPMSYGGKLIGFVGFDSVREEKAWPEEDVRLLRVMGEIFANAVVRRRMENELKIKSLAMNNADRAIVILNPEYKVLFTNDVLLDLLGNHETHEILGQEFEFSDEAKNILFEQDVWCGNAIINKKSLEVDIRALKDEVSLLGYMVLI